MIANTFYAKFFKNVAPRSWSIWGYQVYEINIKI